MSIPQIIHFVWIGPPMPEWAKANIEAFRRLNNEFIVLQHGEDILNPILRPIYDAISGSKELSRKSDLLRISALLEHGGWYFDCDFFPIRQLRDVYRDKGGFPQGSMLTQGDIVNSAFANDRRFVTKNGLERTRKWIANGVIGTTHDSPLLSCILRGILMAFKNSHETNWGLYGPSLFTDITERYPGITHVDSIDNWYRIRPREKSMLAYRAIMSEGYAPDAIAREIGRPLPYALHMAMEEEIAL